MGRKAREVVRRSGIPVIADFPRPHRQPHPADILPLSRLLVEEFTNEQVDRVVLLTTDFVSALTQRANAFPLLPLASNDKDLAVTAKGEPVTAQSNQYREYLFEPSREDVVATLLPRLVELTLYQALLESVASEHASRRMAMKNATDAAKDIIDDVTLTLNQTRQATITREMAEIATAMTAMAA